MKTNKILKICVICIGVGLILTTVGYALGGGSSSFGNVSINGRKIGFFDKNQYNENIVNIDEKLSSFENIDINAEASDVRIIPSDNYKIEAMYNEYESKIEYKVENNTLSINQINTKKNLSEKDQYKRRINIYAPTDAHLKNIKIDSNISNIVVEDLEVDFMSLESNIGNVIIKNSTVNNKFEVETNIGNIEVDGKLYGESSIESNIGNIEVQIDDKKENYDYIIKNKLGKFTINGEHYLKELKNLNNKDNIIKLECDTGNIELNFK